MSYNSTYNVCDDQLDQHNARTCDDQPEKARIRRGGWLHKNSYAAVMEDPTVAANWEAAKDAGELVILPELTGTFDGGTPKMAAGYGDQKEKYVGVDCKAMIKDPEYASNWPHYRSLVGKSSWHFVYFTESRLHVSGVPVTVAPKNPITENIDDDVVWESDISWFEYFTPAPHDASNVLELFSE